MRSKHASDLSDNTPPGSTYVFIICTFKTLFTYLLIFLLFQTHLLFLFSLGHWRNRLCSNELLQSLVLSTIPVKFCGKQLGSWSLNCLIDFSKWFQQTFVIENREELHPDLVCHEWYYKQWPLLCLYPLPWSRFLTPALRCQLFLWDSWFVVFSLDIPLFL
jgi:hypothetical protein